MTGIYETFGKYKLTERLAFVVPPGFGELGHPAAPPGLSARKNEIPKDGARLDRATLRVATLDQGPTAGKSDPARQASRPRLARFRDVPGR